MIAGLVALMCALLVDQSRARAACPSTSFILLDRSESMIENNRWSDARNAINSLLATPAAQSIDFGLIFGSSEWTSCTYDPNQQLLCSSALSYGSLEEYCIMQDSSCPAVNLLSGPAMGICLDKGQCWPTDAQKCAVDTIAVLPATNNQGPIISAIDNTIPMSDTPIFNMLERARLELSKPQYDSSQKSVILISDGIENCLASQGNLTLAQHWQNIRTQMLAKIDELTAAGISVYVVGFGSAVYPLSLNEMADTANTERVTPCATMGTDPNAADNCYYNATDFQKLHDMLQSIGGLLLAQAQPPELCDGVDNDCDSMVDENFKTGPELNPGVNPLGTACSIGGDPGVYVCDPSDLNNTTCSPVPMPDAGPVDAASPDGGMTGSLDGGLDATSGGLDATSGGLDATSGGLDATSGGSDATSSGGLDAMSGGGTGDPAGGCCAVHDASTPGATAWLSIVAFIVALRRRHRRSCPRRPH